MLPKEKEIKKKNLKTNVLAFRCDDTTLALIEKIAESNHINKSKAVNLLISNTNIYINHIENYTHEDKNKFVHDLARLGNLYKSINSLYFKILTSIKNNNMSEIEYQIFKELKGLTSSVTTYMEIINTMKSILNKIDRSLITYGNNKNKS